MDGAHRGPEVRSPKRRSFNGHPMHQASLTWIVVHRIVPSRAIIPKRDRPRLPIKAHLKLRLLRVVIQKPQQGLRLGLAPTFNANREARIDVKNFATRIRMSDHHWMKAILDGLLRVANPARHLL